MLSTGVNPTDGHRFDGDAESFAEDGVHLQIAAEAAGRS
jgi:hypothetical protein